MLGGWPETINTKIIGLKSVHGAIELYIGLLLVVVLQQKGAYRFLLLL